MVTSHSPNSRVTNMHLAVVFLLFVALRCSLSDKENDDKSWEKYKAKFNKTYDTPEEEAIARDNFEQHLHDNAVHNMLDEHNYTVNVHEYSDMTKEEIKEALCGTDKPANEHTKTRRKVKISERALPASVDWVSKGAVSSVKNQGECGSCWSFSAAQAVEGAVFLKTKKLYSFSEQQLIDCSSDYGNSGCDGGWPDNGFDYLENEGGIVQESCHPYTDGVGNCTIKDSCTRYKITSHVDVGPSGNENAVAQSLAKNGPHAIAIHVSDNFMNYDRGIFHDDTCNKDVNHGVLLVGYGTENGVSYWKIKNSWGTSWGEKGYMRMRRNYKNMCKVASYASYPVMK